MKRLAVLTSGGDAPGQAAAVRGVVREAYARGMTVVGVPNGFRGLLNGESRELTPADVCGWASRGGTPLGSARESRMMDEGYQARALLNLRLMRADGLVVIGGSGSQTAAAKLDALTRATAKPVAIVGIASTIDNDLPVFDATLGVDTAINTAMRAIDDLRTTADSFRRAFVVEVMGRDSGYLAAQVALATGADAALVPEYPLQPSETLTVARHALRRDRHALLVVAEGYPVNASVITASLARNAIDARLSVLGHVVRGASPTAADRLLAVECVRVAVERLAWYAGHGVVGRQDGHVYSLPYTRLLDIQHTAGRTTFSSVTQETVDEIRAIATGRQPPHHTYPGSDALRTTRIPLVEADDHDEPYSKPDDRQDP